MLTFTEALALDPKKGIEIRCRTYNGQEGKLTGMDCPLCKNRGVIAYPGETDVLFRFCSCFEKRKVLQSLKKSGITKLSAFEEFICESAWQKRLLRYATAFSERDAGWFYLSGQPGSGKTHLCTAMLNRFLERGKSGRYFLWREDGTRLKTLANLPEYREEIEPFKNCEVLYIDDLFKGAVTQGDLHLAFELLNHRYLSGGITLISSEKSVEEVLGLDEALGSRVYEAARGFRYHIKPSKDKNWRLKE